MLFLDITFIEILKIWFAWNIIPYVIGLIIIFGILGIWILVLKIKGYNLNNYYSCFSEWNKKSKKVKK